MPTTDDLLGQIYQTLDDYSLMEILSAPMMTLGPFLQSIILPMFVGGLIIGSMVWIVFYWVLEKIVREYKHNRYLKRSAAALMRREIKKGSNQDGAE